MSSFLYTSRSLSLSDQPQDFRRRRIDYELSTCPVVIKNALPVKVDLYHEMVDIEKIHNIGPISAGGEISTPPGHVKTGDILHFRYTQPDGKSYFVAPSILFARQTGNISVGSIVSAQNGYNRDTHPNGDISSIKIHNMLPWPIEVYHNGKRVAYVEENLDLGTCKQGNMLIAPYIYFDNGNMGLKLGDVFQLRIDNTKFPDIPTKLYSFAISDRNVSEIFVGRGSTEVDMHMKPETYSYRLGFGNKFPRAYNAIGTDIPAQHGNRVPVAKYKALSGGNVVKI